MPFGPGRSGAMFSRGVSRRACTIPRSLWAASMHTLSVIAPMFILRYFIDFLRLCQWVAAHWITFIILIHPNAAKPQGRTDRHAGLRTGSPWQNALFCCKWPLAIPPCGVSTERKALLLIILLFPRSRDRLSRLHWRALPPPRSADPSCPFRSSSFRRSR